MSESNSTPHRSNRAITYILPSTEWAMLLEIIAQEAPPDSVIEVHEAAMQALAEQTLQRVGRQDITVRLGRPTASGAAEQG